MDKPESVEKYCKWAADHLKVDCGPRLETFYNAVVTKMRHDFNRSVFWQSLKAKDSEFAQEYLVSTGYPLFGVANVPEKILVKPFTSFLEKTYRRNVVQNSLWPIEPKGGWLSPNNCFDRVNDLLRTTYVVKYLDGVDFLFDKFSVLAKGMSLPVRTDYEARDEGYYAGHFNIQMDFAIPGVDWDVRSVSVQVEIQITTQLQEVIRRLLHQHYEKRRVSNLVPAKKWQWDYRSNDFSANYLGHVLHYIEGTILEVRDKEKE
jgi:ppGpp synthetase/RelA/SpoT-type nucleotidyltranferase